MFTCRCLSGACEGALGDLDRVFQFHGSFFKSLLSIYSSVIQIKKVEPKLLGGFFGGEFCLGFFWFWFMKTPTPYYKVSLE